MLCDNLKTLRKSKGLSQEEMAIKLSVVRQTVSKWENGLSVPDSEMLLKIADALDTEVSVLLGEKVVIEEESEIKAIAAKLELLNEQIANKNERNRKLQRIFFVILLIITMGFLIFFIAGFTSYYSFQNSINESVAIIGGADGPTAIFVSEEAFSIHKLILTLAFTALSVFGIYKTRKK